MARGGKNDQINIEDRRAKALELRKGGSSYRAIAKKLNVDVATAYNDVDSALKSLTRLNQSSVEELRTIELERLDTMLLAIHENVKSGHLGAIDRALRIMEQRAKLAGLYAPVKTEEVTWQSEILTLLREGKITREQVEQELGTDLATEFFKSTGLPVTTTR